MVRLYLSLYGRHLFNKKKLQTLPLCRYLQVHTVVPSDGGVLQKLGETFDRLGDRQQAFQYYSDVISFFKNCYFYGTNYTCILFWSNSRIVTIRPTWMLSAGWQLITRRCTFPRRPYLCTSERAKCAQTKPSGPWRWLAVLNELETITRLYRS